MTDGNTYAIAQRLADHEEWDELQEVTAALEQAQDRIEELEAKLAKAVEALEGLLELCDLSTNEINPRTVIEFADQTLAELKGKTDG